MLAEQIKIRKANGQLEPFDAQKFKHSLLRSNASPVLVDKVIEHVAQEVEEGMTTHDIYHHAFSLLHKLEQPAAARYSLRRAITNLGPTGFPFEKFVAEIFKDMGYETLTDQIVQGSCVEHELDVVAWDSEKLIMSEVKFHNELGLKSDLKVTLYVKARFEDLAKVKFNYGGQERSLDEGWLITNTKFTQSATQYAKCQNLKIVGWDYPAEHSLREMIESRGLYPITILNSLSERDKRNLMDKGVILCRTIKDNPEILKSVGLLAENVDKLVREVSALTEPVYTSTIRK